MIKPFNCALVGFSSFERSTFDSFFRLAARRVRGCEIMDDLALSDVVVVNADNASALAQFKASVPKQKVLLVGQADGGTGWPIQPRPIKLMAILTHLNQLLDGLVLVPKDGNLPAVVRTPVAAAQPAAPEQVTKAEPPAAAAAPAAAVKAAPAPVGVARPPRGESTFGTSGNFMGLDGPRSNTIAPDKAARFDDILVVDDSDIALKFMKTRLYRFGFRAELASSGEEALLLVAQNNFKFVFLDVMMTGLDGYQTCRAIKQQKYAHGNPPVVVMLTSRGGNIDKIRGSLAGCDAYLTKPLNEAELLAVLSKHDQQVQRGFQATNLGGSAFT